MNAIKPNTDLVQKLPKVNTKRFAKRSLKAVNDEIDRAAADRLGASGKFVVADMLPVESKVRPLLYDGFTKEEKGRYQYLKVNKRPQLLQDKSIINADTHRFQFLAEASVM